MVVTEVRKIALNLSLPALKIASSNVIPSLKFELNLEIRTKPSLTKIPIRAIIPSNDITLTGKPCRRCPQATVVKLNGIKRMSKNG